MMDRKSTTSIAIGILLFLSAPSPVFCQLGSGSNHQSPSDNAGLPIITGPLSIEEAVTIALKHSPAALVKRAEADAAQARLGMARAMIRPQVTSATFGTTGTMSGIISGAPSVGPVASVLVPDKGQLDQNFMAMVPIYTGGGLRYRVQAAQSAASAALSGLRVSELDVSLNARLAYRRARLNQAFVQVWQRRVEESRERVRIADIAFNEGRIARYDLLRNQTELAEAEQALNNAIRDADIALVDLKTTLGISQISQMVLTSEPRTDGSESAGFVSSEVADRAASQGAVPESVEEARALALARRPELAAARDRIKAAEAELSAARSLYRPQVYGVAMQDFISTSGAGADQGFIIGVTASIPILDAGLRRLRVKEAEAMLQGVRAEERDAKLAILQDVAISFAELQAAKKNLELARIAVEQAEEDYRVIKLRYDAGKAINVEVLDALASLTRAQTNYAQAQFEQAVAVDRLKRAIGET